MRRNLIFTVCAFVLCAFVLTACGGSGGGDSDRFAGVWSGGASLVDDTCGTIGENSNFISFTHLVNQDDEDVILDNGLVTFNGSTTGDDSFTVSADRPFRSLFAGASCAEHVTWRYESIKRDTANFVVRRSTITCERESETQTCEFAFSGQAFRGSGQPIPIDIGIGGSGPVEDGAGTTSSSGGVAETTL